MYSERKPLVVYLLTNGLGYIKYKQYIWSVWLPRYIVDIQLTNYRPKFLESSHSNWSRPKGSLNFSLGAATIHQKLIGFKVKRWNSQPVIKPTLQFKHESSSIKSRVSYRGWERGYPPKGWSYNYVTIHITCNYHEITNHSTNGVSDWS